MSTPYRLNRGENACLVEECQRPFRCSGYCGMHYARVAAGKPVGEADGWTPELAKRTRNCRRCKQDLPPTMFAPTATRCRDCVAARRQKLTNFCAECAAPIGLKSKRCSKCYRASQKGIPRKNGGRRKTAMGYVTISCHHDHPNSNPNGLIFEHKLVMSEAIGRPLLPSENVHHKNGVRDDNRLENLELWSRSQPSGQRVVDKVAWAKELLATYEPEALA